MRLPHHLKVASNGIYYFRVAVPLRLRPLLKKTEIVRSLGTRDPQAAKLLASCQPNCWQSLERGATTIA